MTTSTTRVTKEQALALYGNDAAQLADELGLKTVFAVHMWKNGEPIPLVHALRLRYELKPDAFDRDGRLRN